MMFAVVSSEFVVVGRNSLALKKELFSHIQIIRQLFRCRVEQPIIVGSAKLAANLNLRYLARARTHTLH